LAAIHNALAANAATLAAKLPGFAAPLQIQTLRALGRIKASAQAAAIAPFLKSAIPLRAAAIQSLGKIGATDQAPAVLALLKDAHPTVRREAMDAIAHLADPATQQQRALAGLADPDPTVRQAAARIFKPHPLPEAVDPLVKQLYDPYLPLHDDARQSLTTYTTPAMREQIIAAAVKLLHESNPRRQEDGSFLLGAMKSEADLDFHIGLLTFRKPGDALDWDLYTQAIWSLTQIGNPKAAPPLLPLLKNVPATQGDLLGPKGTVSTVAGEAGFVAAAKFGLKAALPEVNRVLRGNPLEQSADMRAAAVWALGALMPAADHATNQRLLQIAQNTSGVDPARTEAIKCLILRKAPDLLDALQQLNQTDNSPMVRFTAHWACEHLTGQSIPYPPPNAPFKATTSIEDLAAQK
jgi:HEAT repeat protein